MAEALNETSTAGFRSFHDLPAEEHWNIDHVAVGTRGVFLIETKARRRRASRNGQAEHEVIFDGNFLQFPFFKTN
ncbi:MAG: nuclease-related domain-containing protein, partial [Limisphaerales bacterium]